MMVFYPVCLFCYNRPIELKETIKYLSSNLNFNNTDLFVFCDAPKNKEDKKKTDLVKNIVEGISGSKSIKIEYNFKNIGLANSIINGITKVLKYNSAVIVLEDDLVTSKDFLNFMNLNLNKYKNSKKVFSINGYSNDLNSLKLEKYENYFLPRSSSWGWGTWSDRWDGIIWDENYYKNLSFYKYLFLIKGGFDLPFMLRNYINGKIDSWAIRFVYTQVKLNTLSSVSKISKVKNIGFNKNATHTKSMKQSTNFKNTRKIFFKLSKTVIVKKKLLKEFLNYYSFISIIKRKIFE